MPEGCLDCLRMQNHALTFFHYGGSRLDESAAHPICPCSGITQVTWKVCLKPFLGDFQHCLPQGQMRFMGGVLSIYSWTKEISVCLLARTLKYSADGHYHLSSWTETLNLLPLVNTVFYAGTNAALLRTQEVVEQLQHLLCIWVHLPFSKETMNKKYVYTHICIYIYLFTQFMTSFHTHFHIQTLFFWLTSAHEFNKYLLFISDAILRNLGLKISAQPTIHTFWRLTTRALFLH